jgi:amino acid adenylation domain-containing protein
MHKSLELGVAIYGALKAGGVFVPLDPFMPAARLAFILEDCDVRHVVTSGGMTKALSELSAESRPHLYGLGSDAGWGAMTWDEVRGHPENLPDVSIIDQDLSYIMYTSGSTGNPKGMMHTHHGSNSYARWGALHVGLEPADRVASHAPLHFDLSVFDFFSTAQSGATVVLVPEPVTKFPATWTQYIESERISVVFTVPFTLIEMLERGVMEQRDLSSLRWILFGGEPFPPKHLRALMRRLPSARFTNVYGPAEAPSCTCYDVPLLEDEHDEPIPIGTMSVNSAGLILDEDDRECAIGQVGELCVRSSTLTKGYWKRPDLNEHAFFRRESFGPFADVFYRTGDLVVRHEDGLLRFLGRKDRMVKTRGNRVELDEVEAALCSHPAVSEAAAYAVPDGRGSQVILSTVTTHGGRPEGAADIVRHARTRLPGYAVPRDLVVVSELPRTTSGKIDRERLRSNHTFTDPG